MAKKKNKTLEDAGIELYTLTGDEVVQRMKELEEKWEMDEISMKNYAREEGKKENNISVAKKMKKEKLPIETIIKITGLTKEEIDKL